MEDWQVFLIIVIMVGAVIYLFTLPPSSPQLKSAGEYCTNNTDCMSGNCSGGICAASSLYGQCKLDSDCSKGICNNGFCFQSDINGRCNRDVDCSKGGCINNKCKEGFEYFACGFIEQTKSLNLFYWLLLIVSIVLIIYGKNAKGGVTYKDFGFYGPLGLMVLSGLLVYLTLIC